MFHIIADVRLSKQALCSYRDGFVYCTSAACYYVDEGDGEMPRWAALEAGAFSNIRFIGSCIVALLASCESRHRLAAGLSCAACTTAWLSTFKSQYGSQRGDSVKAPLD